MQKPFTFRFDIKVFPVTVNMQKPDRNSIISIIILICLALGIRIYASSPGVVESSYASGIYPYISSSLRTLWGSIPFSVGDILYGLLFLFALWKGGMSVLICASPVKGL